MYPSLTDQLAISALLPSEDQNQSQTGATDTTQLNLLSNVVYGTTGDDVLNFDVGVVDQIFLLEGHDRLTTYGAGDVEIDAGDGSDTLVLRHAGKAVVDAGIGADRIDAYEDTILDASGSEGDDRFVLRSAHHHQIDGGQGRDTLDLRRFTDDASEGVYVRTYSDGTGMFRNLNGSNTDKSTFQSIEKIFGSEWDDEYWGSDANEFFRGDDGADKIYTYGGNDIAKGDEGHDHLNLGDGDDQAYGGAGNDYLNAGAGNDMIDAGDDDDNVRAGTGNDVITAGEGNDFVRGGSGDDWAKLGKGDDDYFGGAGNDTGYGGAGDDMFSAGAGDDWFDGGVGDDIVYAYGFDGGAGDDFFDGGGHNAGGGDTLMFAGFNGDLIVDAMAGTATSADPSELGSDTFTGFESYTLGHGNDYFKGSFISEYVGGGGGDDYFVGSVGNDTMNAGAGQDTVDYSDIGYDILINLKSGFVRATWDWGTLFEDKLSYFEHGIGGSGDDHLIATTFGHSSIDGGAGDDLLANSGTANVAFVFRGAFDDDVVRGFERNSNNVLEFHDVDLANGQDFDDFDQLDSNGDGVVSGADAWVAQIGDDLHLTFDGGTVLVEDHTELTADAFAFG